MKTHPILCRIQSLVMMALIIAGSMQTAVAADHSFGEQNDKLETTNSTSSDDVNRAGLWNKDMTDRAVFISGGLSEHFKYTSHLGFKGVIDYRFAQRFSIGAQAALYYANERLKKERTPGIGLRLAYHLLWPEEHHSQKNWDLYLGTSLDAYPGPVNKDNSEIDFLVDAFAGARFRIYKSLFLWGEVGYRAGSFGLAVKL